MIQPEDSLEKPNKDSPVTGPRLIPWAVMLALVAALATYLLVDPSWGLIVLVASSIPLAYLLRRHFKTNAASTGETATPSEDEPEFIEIVRSYGAILRNEETAPDDRAKQLPFPKDTIKEAIIACLQATEDPDLKEHLQVAYVLLANWDDTGTRPDPAQREDSDAKTRLERESLKQELIALELW